jgi:hypothetical protein
MSPETPLEIGNEYWSTEAGRKFIEISGYILNDGAVTPREVSRVARALGSSSMTEPPGVSLIRDMLIPLWERDATPEELWSLKEAILKVLPSEYATLILARQKEIEAEARREETLQKEDDKGGGVGNGRQDSAAETLGGEGGEILDDAL